MASTTESFLDRILDHKRAEVEQRRRNVSLDELAERSVAAPPPRSLAAALRQPGRVTLIAEVKKASPSKGVLVENFDPLALAQVYTDNGAAAISVLTDERFFQGSLEYLEGIRMLQEAGTDAIYGVRTGNRPVPLLRKDFIIDPYQIYEARAYGADALLLIVAALNDDALGALLAQTRELGMEALVEVHNEAELDRALHAGAAIIGVNNRDLHTFVTTLETTEHVAARLPEPRPVLVSESGIFTAADVARVRACGADAVLVGEALVKAENTAARVRELAGVAD
jgi:indole-3-glycerol phosphate synthase